MKAPPFDYVRATSSRQVFELLERHGDDARLLAGGQTLVATLNMRLSEPALLIDIGAIDEWRGIALDGKVLRIGALATHAEIEHSSIIARHAPLFAQAAPHIAHRAIRNLGTLGGSLAFADPAAEWPACALALDATLVLRSAHGERRVAAPEFFQGLYTTSLAPSEVIVACEIACIGPDERHAFDELARRHGDYAIVGIAASARVRGTTVEVPRLAFFGVADRPVRLQRTEALLAGQSLDAARIQAARDSLNAELDPMADLTNAAATKRHLATVLLERALRRLLA